MYKTSETTATADVETLNLIMCDIYSKTELPLLYLDLVKRYSYAVFKIKNTIPNAEQDNIYNLVKNVNYECLIDKLQQIHKQVLGAVKTEIKSGVSLEKALNRVTVTVCPLAEQGFLSRLPYFFYFSNMPATESYKMLKLYADMRLLLMKIDEHITNRYSVSKQYKYSLKANAERIYRELSAFFTEVFEKQQEEIYSEERSFKSKLKSKIKAAIKPQTSVAEKDVAQEIGIFETKTKINIYELLKENGNKPKFDFLSELQRKELMDLVVKALHTTKLSDKAKEYLTYRLVGMSELGFQYDFSRLMEKHDISTVWSVKDEVVNLKTMLNMYLLLFPEYCCSDRLFLKQLFRYFSDNLFGYGNLTVLQTLENLKIEEAMSLDRLTVSRIYGLEAEAKGHYIASNIEVSNNSYGKSILELLRMEKSKEANGELKILMTKMNVHKFDNKFQKIPLMEFVKISDPKKTSRVLTICISGFVSQNEGTEESWVKFTRSHPGEVYSLNWYSKTMKELKSHFVKGGFGLVQSLGKNVLSLLGSVSSLLDTYKTNPFFAAFEEAVLVGEWLGIILPEIFNGCLINLVAFSLGTYIVKETIRTLQKHNKYAILNNVVLIGGVADKKELEQVLKDSPFYCSNFFSDNDMVLKVWYRICKPANSPCGVRPIELPNVTNHDCSNLVKGHGEYRSLFYEMKKQMKFEIDS